MISLHLFFYLRGHPQNYHRLLHALHLKITGITPNGAWKFIWAVSD